MQQEESIVTSLLAIAEGLENVARALEGLGTNDAFTSMGAIELLAKEMRDGLGAIASAIENQNQNEK